MDVDDDPEPKQKENGAGAAQAAAAAAPAAAAENAPPPPVLKGTLSYNVELRKHVIRGIWSYENSSEHAPQRFELIRNINEDEDPTVLPKDGEFHGSFSLVYYHVTSKGKRKERSKVINERDVKITFTKIDEDSEDEYKVDGEGTNQFGVFYINGTATLSGYDSDPTFNIELRKRYKPSPNQPEAASAGAAVVLHRAVVAYYLRMMMIDNDNNDYLQLHQ